MRRMRGGSVKERTEAERDGGLKKIAYIYNEIIYLHSKTCFFMREKKSLLLLSAFLSLTSFVGAQELPVFSTDAQVEWYFIKVKRSGYSLENMGMGEAVRTAAVSFKDEQLWKFVGQSDNFQLVNKSGGYAVLATPAIPTEGDYANANPLPLRVGENAYDGGYCLVRSGNSDYPSSWEIQPNNNKGQSFNAWGNPRVGGSIGIYDANDVNNPLEFMSMSDFELPDYAVEGVEDYRPADPLTLWYDMPSTLTDATDRWQEYSLPIGTGQFGACVVGGVRKEEIQFNEKTLWSGTKEGNQTNGNLPTNYGYYENFGSVHVQALDDDVFSYTSEKPVRDYVRQLSLSEAKVTVSFKSPDKSVTYLREYLASHPDGVVAMRFQADQAGKINLRFTLESGKPGIDATTAYNAGTANFSGKLQTVSYDARLKVVNVGGEMTTSSDGITVKGADEVLAILGGGTDYDPVAPNYVSGTEALASTVEARVNAAATKTWDQISEDHLKDYQNYFDRVAFAIEGAENNMPTNELVDAYAEGASPNALMLEQLYFHYARYLEIASSRGVALPSNLQGIWNNVSRQNWHSDIHANINVQMNYWPAEPTNLSEMHEPFLDYIINMATVQPQWQGYARNIAGQTKGWTCFTENNIFGGTGSFAQNYVIANAWYCTHLWQHYRYTLDRDFLKRAFPAMWSACEFWLERLVKGSDGTYECPREYSPEHGPQSSNATAHAQQLVFDLFSNTKKAAEILGSDSGVSDSELAELADRLDNLDRGLGIEQYTGAWGASKNGVNTGGDLLREWKYYSYTSGNNGHRHVSHLMCVYPFGQVTPASPYFEAAVNSLKLRGDASTGWSMGWKINLWARMLDGDHAHSVLALALRHSTSYGVDENKGGIYYNLYDSHSPFQIDGNFGACAGMAEMLMQSHTDTIQLLPALPSVWKSGSVSGLKAVGDFTVNIVWKDGKATVAEITSHQGQPLVVSYADIAKKKIFVDGKEIEAEVVNDNTVAIPLLKGQKAEIRFTENIGIASLGGDANGLLVAVDGRLVTLTGVDVDSVRVCDLQGRSLQRSAKPSFKVKEACGSVILLQVATREGETITRKVVL